MANWLLYRSPVYYGWVVMAAGTLGLVMTSPGQSYVASVFIEHFIQDIGISRSLVSSLYTGATLVGSLALPFVGRQIDRYGSRKSVLFVALAFGGACLFMGSVQNAAMLGVGFLGIRFLGQGSLGLVSIHVINQWWIARRGLVMGISGFFVALLGLGFFPVGVNELIQIVGWRTTYVILGLVLVFVMATLGFYFFRDRPEKYGLLPDGDTDESARGGEPGKASVEENWTRAEAVRTPAFWVVAGSAGTISMLMTGLIFHQAGIFIDQGFDAGVAASVFVPLSITMALVTLGGGILADRLSVRILLLVALFAQVVAMLLVQQLDAMWVVVGYGIVQGAVGGFYRVIMSVVWANYFGRLHLGSIMGVAQTIAIGGSALGPMPFGIARDLLGNYEAILLWTMLLPLFFGIANLFVGRPQRTRPSIVTY